MKIVTKLFRKKVNNQVIKEAAGYGIRNLNATSLELNRKGLTKIPDFVFHMKNLKELKLSYNKLTALPPEFGQLKNLEILYLNSNKFTALPPEFGQLKNLKNLYLNSNKFTAFPPEIGQLKNLESLELSDNKLNSLPESIGQLKKLSVIGISTITSLPESIGQLEKLKFLIVDNKLTSLPESFKNLPDNLVIWYGSNVYKKQQFMKKFAPKSINKNTELLNSTFLPTNNIPRGKRVYLDIPSNIKKNNGTLRRVYNKNGINQFIRGREGRARLHGNSFTAENVKPLNNKNFNLQRIRVRLLNTPLNNMKTTIEGVKNRLPPNVSRTDVNNVVRKIKPLVLNKIRNKLRTTPENNRRALLNRYKRDGLINNSDVL
jgi:hypothetical protein